MKQKHILKWLGIALGVYLLYGVLTAILVPLPQKEATGELWSQYEARLSEDASQERVRSIEDTDSALLWRLQLIESAEREVIFSTFDLRADGSGQDLMAARHRRRAERFSASAKQRRSSRPRGGGECGGALL